MATCGDDLCNGLKYVLEQGVQTASQKNQNQQNDNNNTNTYDHDDPEMAMSRPFSTEEASTAAAMSVASSGGGGGGGEKQETAPDAKSAAASLLSTITGGAVFQQQQQKARYGAGDIQATVLMISGCQDAQTSADVSNVSSFTLPDPNGRAGGACTSALLQGMCGATNFFLVCACCWCGLFVAGRQCPAGRASSDLLFVCGSHTCRRTDSISGPFLYIYFLILCYPQQSYTRTTRSTPPR